MLIGACASGHGGSDGPERMVGAYSGGWNMLLRGRKAHSRGGSLQLPYLSVRNRRFYCVRKEAGDVCSRGNLGGGERWVVGAGRV